MRFAHLSDCHIGSWREPKLKDLSTLAFIKAVDLCIKEKVDFLLISGDLFNSSMPSIDCLKDAVTKLKELKDKNIPVYVVAGSHDYSASGKTILDVLENAGMFTNVVQGSVEGSQLKLNFVVDHKTGAKITGMLGKKGMLEKKFYDNLMREHLEQEDGFKIFMFHTALSELKPKELASMDSSPISLLPKNFGYYAGGHVHSVITSSSDDYALVNYPGPLFPNNFRELEVLGNGGFYIVDYENNELSFRWEPVMIYNTFNISIDCSNKTPEEIEQELLGRINGKEFINTIVLIRAYGKLRAGKTTDINFKQVFDLLYSKSAYFVMKNSSGLAAKEFEELKVEQCPVEELERKLIDETAGKIVVEGLDVETEKKMIAGLMTALDSEKEDGEKKNDFDKRLIADASQLLR